MAAAPRPAPVVARLAGAVALAVIAWRAAAGLAADFERLAPSRLPRLETVLSASMDSRRARTLGSDLPPYKFLRANVPRGALVAIHFPSTVTADASVTVQRLGSLLYPTRVGSHLQLRQLRGRDPRLHGVFVLDLDPEWPDAASRPLWKLVASEGHLKLWRGRLADL